MQEHTAISERRACQLAGIGGSVLRYETTVHADEPALRERIVSLASQRRRFGYVESMRC